MFSYNLLLLFKIFFSVFFRLLLHLFFYSYFQAILITPYIKKKKAPQIYHTVVLYINARRGDILKSNELIIAPPSLKINPELLHFVRMRINMNISARCFYYCRPVMKAQQQSKTGGGRQAWRILQFLHARLCSLILKTESL